MNGLGAIQKTVVSRPADNPEDIQAILSVIQTYAEGGRKGDAAIMKHAFREDSTIHGYIDGGLLAGPIHLLFDWVGANPPATDLEVNSVNIDLAHTVATARVEVTGWLGFGRGELRDGPVDRGRRWNARLSRGFDLRRPVARSQRASTPRLWHVDP